MQPRGEQSAAWYAYAAGVITLMTCTTIGNLVILVALRRARRAPAHYPLISLAVADLFVGLLVVPAAGMRELFIFQLHWVLCRCRDVLSVLSSAASIFSLCALSWVRYCGITAPLARAKQTKLARLLALLVWPASFTVALATALIYEPREQTGMDKVCPDNMSIIFRFGDVFLSFYLPTCVMLLMYFRILRALAMSPEIRVHKGRSPQDPPPVATISSCSTSFPDRSSPKTQKSPMDAIVSRQRRATRTVVGLMGLFLICWTPFFITVPIDTLCHCVKNIFWQCFLWLGFSNSALNPLVYAAASPSVRRALKNSLPSNTKTTSTSTTTSQIQVTRL